MGTTTGLVLALLGAVLVGCSDGADGAQGDVGQGATHAHEDATTTDDAGVDLPEGANQLCPVMGNPVDPAIFTEHDGQRVYFCCAPCVAKFEQDPERYHSKGHAHGEGH